MRKMMSPFVKFLILILAFHCQKQMVFSQIVPETRADATILITHPTVNNVKTIIFLISNHIFPAPADIHIIGIYHKNGIYDYRKTTEYIESNSIQNVSLYGFQDSLTPENIFRKNSCTEEIENLTKNSAGIILFGGPDIPPVCYGEETNLLTEISDPFRHYLELTFMFHLLGGFQNPDFEPLLEHYPQYAILGICLGMQTMNVATGGTLIQDIPSEIYNKKTVEEVLKMAPSQQHRNYYTNIDTDDELIWGHFHVLNFEKGCFIELLCKQSPHVWSSHHQCIGKTGKNIIPVAWSEDQKVTEAIVHSKYPNVYGVQFHPEVSAIFRIEDSLKTISGQQNMSSYKSMFPSGRGYDFHIAFWKLMSRIFFQKE